MFDCVQIWIIKCTHFMFKLLVHKSSFRMLTWKSQLFYDDPIRMCSNKIIVHTHPNQLTIFCYATLCSILACRLCGRLLVGAVHIFPSTAAREDRIVAHTHTHSLQNALRSTYSWSLSPALVPPGIGHSQRFHVCLRRRSFIICIWHRWSTYTNATQYTYNDDLTV